MISIVIDSRTTGKEYSLPVVLNVYGQFIDKCA